MLSSSPDAHKFDKVPVVLSETDPKALERERVLKELDRLFLLKREEKESQSGEAVVLTGGDMADILLAKEELEKPGVTVDSLIEGLTKEVELLKREGRSSSGEPIENRAARARVLQRRVDLVKKIAGRP